MANLTMLQQTVKDRTQKLQEQLVIDSEDEAFTRLAHYAVTGVDILSFDEADLVDGGQDKQIDVISIERDDDDEATVYIIQAKNSTKDFSSGTIIHIGNGLEWIFNKSRNEVDELANRKLRDRIIELRDVLRDILPININVVVAYVSNSLTSNLSNEFLEELNSLKRRFDNGKFKKFDFEAIGADEIIHKLQKLEQANKKINAKIKIVYDVNNPSFIKFNAEGIKGVVCTTTAHEIARLVNGSGDGDIFDLNVRRYLGKKGVVNKSIYDTCSDEDQNYRFWFLNNGITIICDQVVEITPDGLIAVKNMQIVNGCQTASTIALADKNGELREDVKVLLRIYETNDTSLVNQIVASTNTQNRISSRNLHTNDPIQIDLESAFLLYDLRYQRKPVNTSRVVNLSDTVSNELVAQAYLAIFLKRPSEAWARRNKVWGEHYHNIFTRKSSVEPYIIAFRICTIVKTYIKKYQYDENDLRRKLARIGAFHISFILSHLLRVPDPRTNLERSKELTHQLLNEPEVFYDKIEDALQFLENLISRNPSYNNEIEAALKSSKLEEEIRNQLYSQHS